MLRSLIVALLAGSLASVNAAQVVTPRAETKKPVPIEQLLKSMNECSAEENVDNLSLYLALGYDPALAVKPLIRMVEKAKKPGAKRFAISVLRDVGPKAKDALPAILAAATETSDFNGSFALGGASNVAEAAHDAVLAIDPKSRPALAKVMVPALMVAVENRDDNGVENALALLARFGDEVRPELPRLIKRLPELSKFHGRECLRVFLAAGDAGMALVADYVAEPETASEIKYELLGGFTWERKGLPATVRMLEALLDDRSALIRGRAVEALGTVQAPELAPKLIKLLNDVAVVAPPAGLSRDEQYRLSRALANQGVSAVPMIVKALDDPLTVARYQAIRAIALLEKDAHKEAAKAVPTLEKLLNDKRPYVQIEAARALLTLDEKNPPARQKLAESLKGDARVSEFALQALEGIGANGKSLAAAAKRATLAADNDADRQRLGLRAMQSIKADPNDVVEVWVALVKKNETFLNVAPRDLIAKHPELAKPALPTIVRTLTDDDDVNLRRRATEVLAAMGVAAADAIPTLIEKLGDDSLVAHGAMDALAAMGPRAEPAVPALVRFYESIKPEQREGDYSKSVALKTLGKLGPTAKAALPRLQAWLPNDFRVVPVLAEIGPDAKESVPSLEELFRDATGSKRVWSAYALAKITQKNDPYLRAIVAVFNDSKTLHHRTDAIVALRQLKTTDKTVLPVLLAALKDKTNRDGFGTDDMQWEAARALAAFGPDAKGAVPDLIDMVKTSYWAAQVAAIETLGAIGPSASSAIPEMEALAQRRDTFREPVDQAIAKIRQK